MTKDRFNALIASVTDARPSETWPFIGMHGDADDFNAFNTDIDLQVRGVFVDKVTPDAIKRSLDLADEAMRDETNAYNEILVLACVLFPLDAHEHIGAEELGNYDFEHAMLVGVTEKGGKPDFTVYVSDDELDDWED